MPKTFFKKLDRIIGKEFDKNLSETSLLEKLQKKITIDLKGENTKQCYQGSNLKKV